MDLGEILWQDQSKELEKYRWQKKKLQRFRGETCTTETTNKIKERNRELCILNAKEGFNGFYYNLKFQ